MWVCVCVLLAVFSFLFFYSSAKRDLLISLCLYSEYNDNKDFLFDSILFY